MLREKEHRKYLDMVWYGLVCVFVCLVGFYGISTFGGYLTPNTFFTNNQFYFKQFSLECVRGLIVKNISISTYSI